MEDSVTYKATLRKLNIFKALLLGVALVGCFASFAQNDYGWDVIKWSVSALAPVFFIEAVIAVKKALNYKKFLITDGICLFFILIFIVINETDLIKIKYLSFVLLFIPFLILLYFIRLIIFIRKKIPGNRLVLLEPGYWFLFFLGFAMLNVTKIETASILITVFSAIILVAIYFFSAFFYSIKEWKKNKWLGILKGLVFLSLIPGALGAIGEKDDQQWIRIIALSTGIVFVIPVIFNLKFRYCDEKITFRSHFLSLGANVHYVLIVVFFLNIYWMAHHYNMAPDFYSLEKPFLLEELEKKTSATGHALATDNNADVVKLEKKRKRYNSNYWDFNWKRRAKNKKQ